MSLERAIKDAAELGDFGPREFRPYAKIELGEQAYPATHVWFQSEDGEECGFPISQILLDPTFWQALGKARGWGNLEWLIRWHGLIDHLAAERRIETFFERIYASSSGPG
jgi:hypothetical protein